MKNFKVQSIYCVLLIVAVSLPSFVSSDECDDDDQFVVPNIPTQPTVRLTSRVNQARVNKINIQPSQQVTSSANRNAQTSTVPTTTTTRTTTTTAKPV